MRHFCFPRQLPDSITSCKSCYIPGDFLQWFRRRIYCYCIDRLYVSTAQQIDEAIVRESFEKKSPVWEPACDQARQHIINCNTKFSWLVYKDNLSRYVVEQSSRGKLLAIKIDHTRRRFQNRPPKVCHSPLISESFHNLKTFQRKRYLWETICNTLKEEIKAVW